MQFEFYAQWHACGFELSNPCTRECRPAGAFIGPGIQERIHLLRDLPACVHGNTDTQQEEGDASVGLRHALTLPASVRIPIPL